MKQFCWKLTAAIVGAPAGGYIGTFNAIAGLPVESENYADAFHTGNTLFINRSSGYQPKTSRPTQMHTYRGPERVWNSQNARAAYRSTKGPYSRPTSDRPQLANLASQTTKTNTVCAKTVEQRNGASTGLEIFHAQMGHPAWYSGFTRSVQKLWSLAASYMPNEWTTGFSSSQDDAVVLALLPSVVSNHKAMADLLLDNFVLPGEKCYVIDDLHKKFVAIRGKVAEILQRDPNCTEFSVSVPDGGKLRVSVPKNVPRVGVEAHRCALLELYEKHVKEGQDRMAEMETLLVRAAVDSWRIWPSERPVELYLAKLYPNTYLVRRSLCDNSRSIYEELMTKKYELVPQPSRHPLLSKKEKVLVIIDELKEMWNEAKTNPELRAHPSWRNIKTLLKANDKLTDILNGHVTGEAGARRTSTANEE